MERTGWSDWRNVSVGLTTPSAPFRWLRGIFLVAQPPLLCEEGNEDAKLFCQTSCIDDSHAVGHLSGFVSDYPFDSRRSRVVETWRYRAAVRQSAPCGSNHR